MGRNGGGQLRGLGAHDDGVAAGDKIAGKLFDGFLAGDLDFLERGGANFGGRFFGPGAGVPGDEVGGEDADGQVQVVKKAVGPAGELVDDRLAGSVTFGDGFEADDVVAELVGQELVHAGVGAIMGADKQGVADGQSVALAAEAVRGFDDALAK